MVESSGSSSGKRQQLLGTRYLANDTHREKPDDELKRENLERKGELPSSEPTSETTHDPIRDYSTASTMGSTGPTSATGHYPYGDVPEGTSEYEKHERLGEHEGMNEGDKLKQAREHDRHRLHKDPPPGYVEKKLEKARE